MRGIILLNGEPWQGEIEDGNAFVVCCDGALRWAKGRVRIDVTAGDFDSLGYVPQGAQVFPVEKDSTDGEIALQMLLSRGCRQIDVYGGGGAPRGRARRHAHKVYGHFLRGRRDLLERSARKDAFPRTRGGEGAYNGE